MWYLQTCVALPHHQSGWRATTASAGHSSSVCHCTETKGGRYCIGWITQIVYDASLAFHRQIFAYALSQTVWSSDILLCDTSLPSDAFSGAHHMPLELVALEYSLSYIPVGSSAFPADLLLTYFRHSFVGMKKELESLPNYHCSPYCSAYSVIECLCPISVPADDNEGICLEFALHGTMHI